MITIKVSLRTKNISNGRSSLYLDFYPPISMAGGKKTRREFLGMYVLQNPTTPLEKKNNSEMFRIAEQIRLMRANELLKPEIYSGEELGKLERKERLEANFIDIYERISRLKSKNNTKGTWYSSFQFMKNFAGSFVACKDITVDFAHDFRGYLLNADSLRWPSQKLKSNTASSYFNKFREVLKYAYIEDYLAKDIRLQVDAIKEVDTHREFLTLDELKRLVKTPLDNDVLRRAAIFSALTGLRFSDIQRLKWGDVIMRENDGVDLRFFHTKTKSLDYQPINNDALGLMGTRQDDGHLVFEGLKYNSNNNQQIKDWIKRAKIQKKITFHCFRHTYATLLLTNGVDIYTISKMLGHKNVKTTQIYAKVIDEKRRDAANVINIGS